MTSKLDVNNVHYPTAKSQMAYIQNRVGGNAAKHLAPRFRYDARNPFINANKVLEALNRVYGDPNRRRTAINEFRRLRQNNKEFNVFWANF